MSYVLKKYGTATTILFPLVDRGTLDFEATPVTHSAGDTQISKDEGAFGNTTNAFAHEGNGIYSLALTDTEMQAATVVVTVIDSATKLWEDQAIIIDTYGNASAEHGFDLDVATQDVNVASIDNDAITAASIATDAIGGAELAADAATEVAAAVWNSDATTYQTGGTFGQAIGDPGANTETMYDAVVTDAAGTNVAADVIAVKAETAAILDDTDLIDDATSGLAKIATDAAAILVDTAEIGAAGAGLTEAGGTGDHLTAVVWNANWDAEVQSEVADALAAAYGSEISQQIPTAVASAGAAEMIAFIYNALINKIDITATAKEFHDTSGTVVAKKALSDDGTTFSEAKAGAGP